MRWTPSGPNGVPNGSDEEKYSISASRPLQERLHAPTNFLLFLIYMQKFLGARFRPFVPT
jgi:hypothetical protein